MKKLSIIFLLLVGLASTKAQTWKPLGGSGQIMNGIKMDGPLILVNDTLRTDAKNVINAGNLGFIAAPGDTSVWVYTGRIWQKIATGSGSTLVRDSVQQLSILPGKEEAVVVVKDTLRGGVFYWAASGYTADNGVVFAAPSGYWIRRYDRATGINVRWYGPANNVVTDDISKIQSAVNRAAADSVGYVRMNGLRMLIGSAIQLPSNITLDATGSYIELKKASNEDFVRNKDLVNGNNNIKVFGGHWSGNGWTQTRTIAGTVSASNFCYGFFFHKVEDLEIGNMQIDSTRSWAIAVMIGNRVHVHDVYVQQSPFDVNGANPGGVGRNGDGVTMNASNAVVENIRGYTNDDMIAFAAGGAEFQGGTTPFERLDYKNVVARNIFPENMLDSIPTYRAVGVYTFQRHRLDNITIENVAGETTAGLVYFSDPFNDKAYFSNVNIKNIAGTTKKLASAPVSFSTFGLIGTNAAEIDNITVDGIRRIETVTTSPVAATFRFRDSTRINNISISNVYVSHKNIAGTLIQDDGTAKNINLSNITMIDTNNIVGQYLYSRAATPFTTDSVFIRGSSVNVTVDGNANKPIVRSGMKISYSGATPLMDDTLNFSARDGDIISAKNIGFTYYYAGKWQQTNGFMKETTTGSYNFNNANGTTGFFMTGNTNTPTGVAYHGLTIPHAATFASQFALRNNAFWYRSLEAGTWQPWLQVADRAFVSATYQPIITASNGISKTGNNLTLGGSLTANTTISGTNNTYDLTLDSIRSFVVNTANTIAINVKNAQNFYHGYFSGPSANKGGIFSTITPNQSVAIVETRGDSAVSIVNRAKNGLYYELLQRGDTLHYNGKLRLSASPGVRKLLESDANGLAFWGGNWIQDSINLKQNLIVAGTAIQYWRGDKTFQNLNVGAVSGLQDSLNNRIYNQQSVTQTPATFKISGVGTAAQFITTIGTNSGGLPHYSLFSSGGVGRIIMGLYGTESGSNSGSNFFLSRMTDAGVAIGDILRAERSTGNVTIPNSLYLGGVPVTADRFSILGRQRIFADSALISFSDTVNAYKTWRIGVFESNFYINENNSNANRLTILPGGNVGLGITPTQRLHVSGNAIITGNMGSATVTASGNATITGGEVLLNNGTSNWVFAGSGRGIPAFTTRSAGTKYIIAGSVSGSNVDYAFGADMSAGNTQSWYSMPSFSTGHALKFFGGNTQVAAIDATGRMALGSTSLPTATLDVTGDAKISASIITGGIVASLRLITANYTATNSDYTIINRATSGTPTLTLPAAAGNVGRIYFLSDEAGTPNMMTLSPGITYKGTTYTTFNNPFFIAGPRALVQSDGTSWTILIQ